MTDGTPRFRHGQLVGQIIIAMLVIAIVALAPPARGAMLIVSFAGDDAGDIARWAIGHEVRLLGAGPVPHSLVVYGSRETLFGAVLRHRGLLITGAYTGCGKGVQG